MGEGGGGGGVGGEGGGGWCGWRGGEWEGGGGGGGGGGRGAGEAPPRIVGHDRDIPDGQRAPAHRSAPVWPRRHDVDRDFSLPALDLRLVGRRAALPLALAAVALAVVLSPAGRCVLAASSRALSADPRWIASRPSPSCSRSPATSRCSGSSVAVPRPGSTCGERRDHTRRRRRHAVAPTAGAGGAALTLWSIAEPAWPPARRPGAAHVPLACSTASSSPASRCPAR